MIFLLILLVYSIVSSIQGVISMNFEDSVTESIQTWSLFLPSFTNSKWQSVAEPLKAVVLLPFLINTPTIASTEQQVSFILFLLDCATEKISVCMNVFRPLPFYSWFLHSEWIKLSHCHLKTGVCKSSWSRWSSRCECLPLILKPQKFHHEICCGH